MANEFNSRNATLSINQQTISQRSKTEDRFRDSGKILGVGSSNSSILFGGEDGSPIGYDNENNNGLSNREFGEGINTVYSLYAETIDDEGQVTGFGFSGSGLSETAFMNYNHTNNPFKNGDYTVLTNGDKSSEVKAYRGFPDLQVGDVHNPAKNQTKEDIKSELELEPDGATYGHTTTEYRRDTSELASMLGRHVKIAGEGNGTADTLGKYFTKRIEEIEEIEE